MTEAEALARQIAEKFGFFEPPINELYDFKNGDFEDFLSCLHTSEDLHWWSDYIKKSYLKHLYTYSKMAQDYPFDEYVKTHVWDYNRTS